MATTPEATERTNQSLHIVNERVSTFSGDLYRYHGMRVFDAHGRRVGIVDWVWSNEQTGAGDHIGLHLQWLRGKARVIPVDGALVNLDRRIVALPFTKQEIDSAPRFKIDRGLSTQQRARVAAHFGRQTKTLRSASLGEHIAA